MLIFLLEVMSCYRKQKRQEHGHVKGSVAQMWIQQQFINFVVANVSLVGYLVTVLQMQRTALQQKSLSLWCLVVTVSTSFGRDCWLRTRQDSRDDLKRLFMMVQSDNVRPFLWSVGPQSLRASRELDFSLLVYATRSPSCSRQLTL